MPVARFGHWIWNLLYLPLLLLLGASLVTAYACGPNERTFSAAEFVAAANEKAAGLELGEPLPAGSPDPHYEVLLAAVGRSSEPDAELPTGEPLPGTLRVTAGTTEAVGEHARCEQTVTVLCFRAANIVLYFEEEEAAPGALTQLTAALRAMGEE